MARSFILTFAALLLSFQTFAAERSFRVYSSRTLTPQVERLYGKDDVAFATMFCKQDAHQVMFVDSRHPDLDGKNFFFNDLAQCKKAQSDAHDQHQNCNVTLVLDQSNMKAVVTKTACQ